MHRFNARPLPLTPRPLPTIVWSPTRPALCSSCAGALPKYAVRAVYIAGKVRLVAAFCDDCAGKRVRSALA